MPLTVYDLFLGRQALDQSETHLLPDILHAAPGGRAVTDQKTEDRLHQ